MVSKVVPISGDVSDFADAKRMVDQAIAELGSVDVLVNNAGITRRYAYTQDDRRRLLKKWLRSTWRVLQHDASSLETDDQAREGQSSTCPVVVGLMGNIGQANYAASKAGLIVLPSHSTWSCQSPVRVNALTRNDRVRYDCCFVW